MSERDSDTFERLSFRARMAIAIGIGEARRCKQNAVGTEYILFGLLNEGRGVAASVLKRHGVDLNELHTEMLKGVSSSRDRPTMSPLPLSPRTEEVLRCAREEEASQSAPVNTGHILLSLIREPEGGAARVLTNLGVKLEDLACSVRESLANAEDTHENVLGCMGIM